MATMELLPTTPPTALPQLATIDLEHVRNEWTAAMLNTKDTTRTTYSRAIKCFFDWVQDSGRSLAATAQDVNAYREHLLRRRNADGTSTSPLTATAYLTAVRRFYEWTEENGWHPNVAAKVKSAKRDEKFQRLFLTPEQATALLDHFQDNLRDLAMVNLALRTGMRTAEIVGAKVGGLRKLSGRAVLEFKGKARDHDRDYVILTSKACQPLAEYLDNLRPHRRDDEPLFTSQSNRNKSGHMDTRSVRRIIGKGLEAVGLTGREYTAHSLRHTTAVTLIRAGVPLDQVQEEMRHSNIDTTRIYLRSIQHEERLNRAAISKIDSVF
jgi:integrase/recombinase XerD